MLTRRYLGLSETMALRILCLVLERLQFMVMDRSD